MASHIGAAALAEPGAEAAEAAASAQVTTIPRVSFWCHSHSVWPSTNSRSWPGCSNLYRREYMRSSDGERRRFFCLICEKSNEPPWAFKHCLMMSVTRSLTHRVRTCTGRAWCCVLREDAREMPWSFARLPEPLECGPLPSGTRELCQRLELRAAARREQQPSECEVPRSKTASWDPSASDRHCPPFLRVRGRRGCQRGARADIASSSSIEINSPLPVVNKFACIGPIPG